MDIQVGDKVRYRFPHLMQEVTCTATVAKVEETAVLIRFGPRVTSLPFPPCSKGKLLRVNKAAAIKAKVTA